MINNLVKWSPVALNFVYHKVDTDTFAAQAQSLLPQIIINKYYHKVFFTTNYDIATFGSSHDLHTDHLVHFFQIIISKMVSIMMVIKAALRKKLYYVGRIQNNQLDFLLLKWKLLLSFLFGTIVALLDISLIRGLPTRVKHLTTLHQICSTTANRMVWSALLFATVKKCTKRNLEVKVKPSDR